MREYDETTSGHNNAHILSILLFLEMVIPAFMRHRQGTGAWAGRPVEEQMLFQMDGWSNFAGKRKRLIPAIR
jgi:hypothetical protein